MAEGFWIQEGTGTGRGLRESHAHMVDFLSRTDGANLFLQTEQFNKVLEFNSYF
jgi:hypothetical protein